MDGLTSMRTSYSFRITTSFVLFFWALDCVQIYAQQTPPADKPIQFIDQNEFQGTDLILEPGATILIGEIHGTWETPILVASLVRQAVIKDTETILCVELSSSEQASIERFLNSDGGETAIDSLLRSPHWNSQDGRASIGMFGMLELLRRLRNDGKQIRVVAMDSSWEAPSGDIASLPPEELKKLKELANGRDREMAESVIQARARAPKAIVIAFAGNVHAKVVRGAPWDPKYIPMGWYVSQKVKNLVSLNAETSGGQAWVMTDRGIGPTNFKGDDNGSSPFVKLLDNAETGYHGTLYVGRISAARPAKAKSGG
ncbi:MAG: hypothetical protein R3C17_16525 [Planctomycetaceae bacterium]